MSTETTLDRQTAATPRGFTRYLPIAARFLMGFLFFVFGLNGFLNFIPPPSTPMPDGVMAFSAALMNTGYMFPLIKGTELLGGILLLMNRFVPLALAL
ncbi:MAG: DoxX family protein, partial [Verrucomicrobiota bacterium]